ncbi:MAG TPA: lipid A-modifier LpxR family protein, partial [Bacteroidia bacterium]|nr:lipid A-modifier LpxR family protein [Bacteroidia bacterium]
MIAHAQQNDTLSIPVSEHGFFSYRYENDVFTNTDYYYTQGVQALLVLPVFNNSPLKRLLPSVSRPTSESNGIYLQQDCYTPTSIAADSVRKGDRPYSGTIFGEEFRTSNNADRKQRLTTAIDLGLIGRCAVCE